MVCLATGCTLAGIVLWVGNSADGLGLSHIQIVQYFWKTDLGGEPYSPWAFCESGDDNFLHIL